MHFVTPPPCLSICPICFASIPSSSPGCGDGSRGSIEWDPVHRVTGAGGAAHAAVLARGYHRAHRNRLAGFHVPQVDGYLHAQGVSGCAIMSECVLNRIENPVAPRATCSPRVTAAAAVGREMPDLVRLGFSRDGVFVRQG